jgi:hypothetical protein
MLGQSESDGEHGDGFLENDIGQDSADTPFGTSFLWLRVGEQKPIFIPFWRLKMGLQRPVLVKPDFMKTDKWVI